MKKKLDKIIIIISLIVLLVIGVTMAFYKATLIQNNKLSLKDSGVSVIEEYGERIDFLPGETIDKKIKFKNEKTLELFIRFKLEDKWTLIDGEPSEAQVGAVEKKYTDFFNNNVLIGNDGWNYYKKVLKPKEITPDIMSAIKLSEEVSNDARFLDYSQLNYKLDILVEALPIEEDRVKNLWGASFTRNSDEVNWVIN